MTNDTKTKCDQENNRLLFEHGWKYFELHANQRISLIRYYIVFFSLYVAGVGFFFTRCNLTQTDENCFIIIISIIFILILIVFFFLDCRNRKLIHIAETALRSFEKEHVINLNQQIFIREMKITKQSCYCLIRHTYCFRALFFITFVSAIVLICYSLNHINPCKVSSLNAAQTTLNLGRFIPSCFS